MNITIPHGRRTGEMKVPSSKSQAHRLLICAALSRKESVIRCDGYSKDIEATVNCLNALGAKIVREEPDILQVSPVREAGEEIAHLYCGESGSTLRFLIPVCGALGKEAVFHMEGRLPERPVDELEKACSGNGMSFTKSGNELRVSGKLTPGAYSVDGRISSQFITGLLFALPMLAGSSTLKITGGLESSAYIRMTEDALEKSGISFIKNENDYTIEGGQAYSAPEMIDVECDWSGAAFPLCMGAFSTQGITVRGLNTDSVQGDKKILDILSAFGTEVTVNGSAVTVKRKELHGTSVFAAEIPDLVPVICVVAAAAIGETRITGAARLRLKESDRIKSTADMINSLGGEAFETEDGLIIKGKKTLSGGLVNSFGDHRIAMSAAAAASVCERDVIITEPECSDKSFPGFFERFLSLEAE